jgi:hypothetical protein
MLLLNSQCISYFMLLGSAITTVSHQQLQTYVNQVRSKEFGDWNKQIVSHPLRSVSMNDSRTFLQFYTHFFVGVETESMICWGHPDLIHLMKHGACPVFMDCTFKVVPRDFLNF